MRDSSFVNKQPYTQTIKMTAQFINIPIFAEYTIGLGGKWNLVPSLGLVINYLVSAQSTYTNTLTNEILISDKTNFKTMSVSGLGGLKLEYLAKEKWSIFLAANYTLFAGNLYKDSGVLKIAPSGFNTNMGLRYYFQGRM